MLKRKNALLLTMMTAVLFSFIWANTAFAESNSLDVEFTWDGIRRCTGISPEIRVANIPEGTVAFQVKLKDHDSPDYNHGGGTVPNDGSGIIAKKALKPDFGLKNRYRGPCPPMGSHTYEFTVKAVDADGKVLAEGHAVQPFS